MPQDQPLDVRPGRDLGLVASADAGPTEAERRHPVAARCARVLLASFVFLVCIAFSEAAPYDLAAIPTMALWLALGVRLHRGALPLVFVLAAFLTGVATALVPYLDAELSVTWTIQLAYLALTAIFFAMLFAQDSHARMEIALKAYVASCVVSACCGAVGYLDLLGVEDLFYRWDRATGTFQDPNVFGSFLILGALYLVHGLMTGATRRPAAAFAALLVIVGGVFLSFSRGSWGALLLAGAMMIGSVYLTSGSRRLRRRIVLVVAATGLAGFVALVGLLSFDGVAKTFETRATATQSYDEGETGRFGNQVRGAKMLIELPFGMGPLRWRRLFEIEPHNSYIGAFANGGWLGGAAFLLLVGATTFVALRLMTRDTPYRHHAQIVGPALIVFFFQGFQIDVEKWRHVYIMLGMVWGLEAARVLWETRRDRAARRPGPAAYGWAPALPA